MRKTLLIILSFSIATIVFGQSNKNLDSLLRLRGRFANTNKDDSLIMVCKEIKSSKFKLTETEEMDYDVVDLDADIVDAYFRLGQFATAIPLAEQYLKMSAVRGSFKWDVYQVNKHYVCIDLSDYYKNIGDNKNALKYILLAEKKYTFGMCGVGLDEHLKNWYQKIVDCYLALNDQKNADKYRKKIAELGND